MRKEMQAETTVAFITPSVRTTEVEKWQCHTQESMWGNWIIIRPLLLGMEKDMVTLEHSLEVSYKTNYAITVWL